MTEAEWLTITDLYSNIQSLEMIPRSDRKVRWFGVACCNQLRQWSPDWPSYFLVALLEEIADGLQNGSKVPKRIVGASWNDFPRPYQTWAGPPPWASEDIVLEAAFTPFIPDLITEVSEPPPIADGFVRVIGHMRLAARLHHQYEPWVARSLLLLRDIFGNPFRPVTFTPEWRTAAAVALAESMYQTRDFGAMPILADALQDAGCENEDILSHCRGPGPHVRGCWVVDLVTGRE